jgi:hypothetical protein
MKEYQTGEPQAKVGHTRRGTWFSSLSSVLLHYCFAISAMTVHIGSDDSASKRTEIFGPDRESSSKSRSKSAFYEVNVHGPRCNPKRAFSAFPMPNNTSETGWACCKPPTALPQAPPSISGGIVSPARAPVVLLAN